MAHMALAGQGATLPIFLFKEVAYLFPSLLKAEVPCKGKSSFRMCLTQEISSTSGAPDQSTAPK